MKQRLHKVIADSGLASRREAERWIAAGRVKINGRVIKEMGIQVDCDTDEIRVDERPLRPARRFYYYLFNKPRNVLVARKDPRRRPIIYDYLTDLPALLHPVGRLDFDSEGLILLTNDGRLNQALSHPSREVPKSYHVKIKGHVSPESRKKLMSGIQLKDGMAHATSVKEIKRNPHNSWLEIVVTEGRNRLVRRMCEALEHDVMRLVRVQIANLNLGSLRRGRYRRLTSPEVAALTCYINEGTLQE